MSVVVPVQNDYSSVATSCPRYRFRNFVSDSVPVRGVSTTTQLSFRIAAGSSVINLARSRFSMTETYTAETKASVLHVIPPFASVQLSTASGALLCDIQNFIGFYRAVGPYAIKNTEWDALPTASQTTGLGPLAQTKAASGDTFIANNAALQALTQPYQSIAQYIKGGDSAATTIYWEFDLAKALPHTIFSLPNDLYFNEQLTLTITLASAAQRGFTALAATLDANIAAPTVAGSYSSALLRVAVQDSQEIAASVRAQILTQGMSLPCQNSFVSLIGTDNSNSFSYQWALDASRGSSLLRVYSVPTVSNATGMLQYNVNNAGSSKWSTVRSYLNQVPCSDSALTVDQVFYRQRELMSDSIVYHADNWLQSSSAYIDDWSGIRSVDLACGKTPLSGVSLSSPIQYAVEYTKTGAVYTLCSVFVFLKFLKLSSSGARLESV